MEIDGDEKVAGETPATATGTVALRTEGDKQIGGSQSYLP